MSFSYDAPPPPPLPVLTTANGGITVVGQPPTTFSDNNLNVDAIGDTSPSTSSSSVTSSIIIVIIIISSSIILSASIYILLRFLSRRFHGSFRTYATADDVVRRDDSESSSNGSHLASGDGALRSLPLFTFGSVTGNLTGGDCAVCLSKFEPDDQLRLLPLCCHAFHARCIDAWLVNNQTCPLCRSTVYPTDEDVLNKILSISTNDIRNGNENNNSNGNSFRIEIGSVSRRRGAPDETAGEGRRTYSIGSFEYIVDDGYAVTVDTPHRRIGSDCTSVDKESIGVGTVAPPGESLAANVAGSGRNWLREYVDRLASFSLSSRAMSFRSSGRFFSGSSRRSDVVVPVEDLEANRMGEEISELFGWLSGV